MPASSGKMARPPEIECHWLSHTRGAAPSELAGEVAEQAVVLSQFGKLLGPISEENVYVSVLVHVTKRKRSCGVGG